MSDKAKSARLDGFEARLRRIEQLLDEEPSDAEQVQRLQKRLAQQREVIRKLRSICEHMSRAAFDVTTPLHVKFGQVARECEAVLEETKGWDE